MILIAHNIRSLHNVGSLFRSADAFGVARVYLTGYTGQPPRKEIAKTALGSEDRVAWEHREDILALIDELKTRSVRVIAIETGDRAVPILEAVVGSGEVALIMGNEVEGIEPEVLAACDIIAEIPMPGRKRSLNVSVAAGIALFTFSRK